MKKYFLILILLALLCGAFLYLDHNKTRRTTLNKAYGISVGGINGMSESKVNADFQGISKLGFKWVRFDFAWSSIQPKDKDNYDWASLDQDVTLAKKYNLQILGIIDFAPNWAAEKGCDSSNQLCAPANPATFSNFAGRVAKRYKGRVRYWEIWNEENLSQFWGPKPNEQEYAILLKDSYRSIKAANDKSFILLGGLSDTNSANIQLNVNAITYLNMLYAYGIHGFFDAIGFHPYTYPLLPLSSKSEWNELNNNSVSIRSLMSKYGDGNKKIWLTEYGAPTNGPSVNTFVSQLNQAEEASEAYAYTERNSWLNSLFWYTYKDSGTSTQTNQNFFGLKSANGEPKLAYSTWEQLLKGNAKAN
jgi:GH35 family endo-1,4-beta-xylanase